MKTPIIIDCDPGWDDAIAIILALFSDKLDVKAITTVAGNMSVQYTTENAKKILAFCKSNIPLARGADKPLVYPLKTIEDIYEKEFNGTDGLFGLLNNVDYKIDERKAHDLIKDILLNSKEKITIVAIGALTNIALFINEYPNVLSKIDKICLMGGGINYANATPYAEFNFYVDPHAAKIVFDSGIPIVMCGLDVSYSAIFKEEDNKELKEIPTARAKLVSDILEKSLKVERPFLESNGAPLYDPTTIVYLINPDIFKTIDYKIDIEIEGEKRGQSIVISENNPNSTVVMDVNREKIINILKNELAKDTTMRT